MEEDDRPAMPSADDLMGPAFLQNPLPMTITNGQSNRFTAANFAFLELTGFWRSDVIGSTSEELNLWVHRDSRASIGAELERSAVVGPVEGQLRVKSGEIISCRYAFRLLSANGLSSVLTVVVPEPW